MTVPMIETTINKRWALQLPEHRAARGEWWDTWELERLAAMHDTIRPGDVVYDIGAEEGDLSALYALWGAGVVLFEPNDRVWPNIKAIFEANGLRPLGWMVGFAADSTELRADCHSFEGSAEWPKCADGPIIGDHGFANLSERPDIFRTTLDDFAYLIERVPDVITIDSEGSELRVLKGAEQTLSNHRPEVFVSIHPAFLSDMYQDSQDELMKYMDDLGYDAKFLAEDHELHYHFSPF